MKSKVIFLSVFVFNTFNFLYCDFDVTTPGVQRIVGALSRRGASKSMAWETYNGTVRMLQNLKGLYNRYNRVKRVGGLEFLLNGGILLLEFNQELRNVDTYKANSINAIFEVSQGVLQMQGAILDANAKSELAILKLALDDLSAAINQINISIDIGRSTRSFDALIPAIKSVEEARNQSDFTKDLFKAVFNAREMAVVKSEFSPEYINESIERIQKSGFINSDLIGKIREYAFR
ncbi:hypothetical protein KAW80_03025 [Candidatus Babeliales bacterium]|nr:hypothetical protein [Candidatus Babeliales bacterium]